MDEYAVLVFRPLTDEEQLAFTHNFGELKGDNTPRQIRRKDEGRGLCVEVADFSNLDKLGNAVSDRVWFF